MSETDNDWITPGEAARMLGYSENYFRTVFCDPSRPLIMMRTTVGPKGQRRIFIRRIWVLTLIDEQTQKPA